MIGPVDNARRGALVRQISLAEEPTESAAKKRQCETSHRSKERDECAIRATAAEGRPEMDRRLYGPSLKSSWGVHWQG